MRVQQDLVFSLHARPDEEVGPRGWNGTFGLSDEVRMMLQKTNMIQYAPVRRPCTVRSVEKCTNAWGGARAQKFKEWGFDETSAVARIQEQHLIDMGVKVGHRPALLFEIARLQVRFAQRVAFLVCVVGW